MTHKEFIGKVVAKHGSIKTQEVSVVLDAVWAVIEELLASGQDVVLGRLGRLKAVVKVRRMGRNPKTGEAIEIPEHSTVTFKPFGAVRELFENKN